MTSCGKCRGRYNKVSGGAHEEKDQENESFQRVDQNRLFPAFITGWPGPLSIFFCSLIFFPPFCPLLSLLVYYGHSISISEILKNVKELGFCRYCYYLNVKMNHQSLWNFILWTTASRKTGDLVTLFSPISSSFFTAPPSTPVLWAFAPFLAWSWVW